MADANKEEKKANAHLDTLDELARRLHGKVESASPDPRPTVLVFVGAGASRVAGLPLGEELKSYLNKDFVTNHTDNATIRELLAEEILAIHGHYHPAKLTLFEFVAVISRFAYGRKVIRTAIEKYLSKPTHRPLNYELLTHLAKHRYVDHFVVLNFDRLLDEALLDELPERAKVVASAQDIPSAASRTGEECFAVHPFGILGEGPYSLTPDDLARFGPHPIREFVEEKLLPWNGDPSQPLLLLLVGYNAAEPAFARFLRTHQDKWQRNHARKRQIDAFAINPDQKGTDALTDLQKEGVVSSIHHIALEADCAFELLLDLLKIKWKASGHLVWIPTARHKIVSRLFSYRQLTAKDVRFKIELLLQGMKSRGFVHLEAFGHIPRLRNYGSHESAEVIAELLEHKVLMRDRWQPEDRLRLNYVPNFMIEDSARVIDEFRALARSERGIDTIEEWYIDGEKAPRANFRKIDAHEFLKREINFIHQAPEIEIVRDAAPEVPWTLGPEARALLTIDELTKETRSILEQALKANGPVKIWGIWSTGEWLFHKDGWAFDLGDKLLGRDDIELKVLITRRGGVIGDRSIRRDAVAEKLLSSANVQLGSLNWWELNRILTLVQDKDGRRRAIYMRRRLSRPLVCPYLIECHAERALSYLDELWDHYWDLGKAPLRKIAAPGRVPHSVL